jgi:hypothetical protein
MTPRDHTLEEILAVLRALDQRIAIIERWVREMELDAAAYQTLVDEQRDKRMDN